MRYQLFSSCIYHIPLKGDSYLVAKLDTTMSRIRFQSFSDVLWKVKIWIMKKGHSLPGEHRNLPAFMQVVTHWEGDDEITYSLDRKDSTYWLLGECEI